MVDYPKAFFIVHKRFGSFGWGDVGDGPVLAEDLTDVLIEAWKDNPDPEDFRVWGIALGRSEDRTAWALRNMTETRKERQ